MDLRNFSGGTGTYRTSDGKFYENSNEAYNRQTDLDFAAQHPEMARAEAAFVGEQAAFLYAVLDRSGSYLKLYPRTALSPRNICQRRRGSRRRAQPCLPPR
jgi:hypothetical protein